jgi:hypothetical protein
VGIGFSRRRAASPLPRWTTPTRRRHGGCTGALVDRAEHRGRALFRARDDARELQPRLATPSAAPLGVAGSRVILFAETSTGREVVKRSEVALGDLRSPLGPGTTQAFVDEAEARMLDHIIDGPGTTPAWFPTRATTELPMGTSTKLPMGTSTKLPMGTSTKLESLGDHGPPRIRDGCPPSPEGWPRAQPRAGAARGAGR